MAIDRTWKLTLARHPAPHLTTWQLEFGAALESSHHVAIVTLDRREQTVSVKFEAASITYARAEAARAYAVMADTLGDLAFGGGEPLDIEPDSLQLDLVSRCPRVTVRGPEALLLVAPAFGDDMMGVV